MSPLPQRQGTHLLADLYGIDAALLSNSAALEAAMQEAAHAAGATILNSHFHAFGAGHGVTGVMLLAESHLSVHTWPETGYAAFDVFMCGQSNPRRALDVLIGRLEPRHQELREILRG